MRYPYPVSRISPTLEGFRLAFRRPSITFAEITWRWVVGATATVLFFFGLIEYLDTLRVTDADLLFLRTRQPFFVWQAITHILRGSFTRGALSLILAALLLAIIWMVSASLGRIATVEAMLAYFRTRFTPGIDVSEPTAQPAATAISARERFAPLLRLNFLRVCVFLAGVIGLFGAAMISGSLSSPENPRPGLGFLLFVPISALLCLFSYELNWLLSLAAIFAVRDGDDAVEAISAAVALCQERAGAVFAVSTWTGLGHLAAFVAASTVVAIPLGFVAVLPWRIIAVAVILLTLAYLAVADWLYTARLAGYVCIAEMPDALLAPMPPPITPPYVPPVQTTIDRDEPILSDVPGLVLEGTS